MPKEKPKIKKFVVGPLLTNCYLILSKKEAVVVDPGGEIDEIFKIIDTKKIKLKYIINTHFHPDHVFGNNLLKKKTGAKILIHQKEKDFINFQPFKFLKENNKIKAGDIVLEVFHTPGHTKGSICLLGEDFIFTGDTLFKDSIGRTDLPGGSKQEMKLSLKKLKKVLKSGMNVCPGHGEVFKIKKDKSEKIL